MRKHWSTLSDFANSVLMPSPQGEHSAFFPLEYVPTSHASQLVEPLLAAYPGRQSKHAVKLVPFANFPTLQSSQEAFDVVSENLPGVHTLHIEAPALEKVPALQAVHKSAPFPENFPS
jgi:hypothetical protein